MSCHCVSTHQVYKSEPKLECLPNEDSQQRPLTPPDHNGSDYTAVKQGPVTHHGHSYATHRILDNEATPVHRLPLRYHDNPVMTTPPPQPTSTTESPSAAAAATGGQATPVWSASGQYSPARYEVSTAVRAAQSPGTRYDTPTNRGVPGVHSSPARYDRNVSDQSPWGAITSPRGAGIVSDLNVEQMKFYDNDDRLNPDTLSQVVDSV